ncbi:MAG: FlgD immunoglobulin-like domain containing protein [candidate division Zixibacteria bacterium]|nr:FlgD immunoglobulin-like domain containing protein [candidate division Zixibacteria bacterium]
MSHNKKIILFLTLVLLVPSLSQSGDYINYSLETPASGLAGNSVVEIIWDGRYIWAGTGNGLSRSSDGGRTWQTFDHTNGLNQDGISALAYNNKDSTLWVATSYTLIREGVSYPFGDGFNKTTNQGQIWASFKPEQASEYGKLAYDIAISDTTVWAACFCGGLIRSKDDGLNWENVFVDSIAKAYYEQGKCEDFRNSFFSVVADVADTFNSDTTFIWGGTAAGIFKFVYTTSDTADTVIGYQQSDTLPSISGNFVVSLAVQKIGDKKIVWAGTQPTYNGSYAASFTTDNGVTWSQTLAGDKIWNFDFEDSVVWAATSSGLKRSTDLGTSWKVFNYMQDKDQPDQQIWSTEFYAVRVVDDSIIWAGNFDGLVKSTDDGISWKVYRSFAPIGTAQAKSSYAYPNPFSPMTANQKVRIHYKPDSDGEVTIKIYDFEMKLVKTVLENAPRAGGVEYDQVWDGKNEKDEIVANGIYFFKIEGPGGQKEWGKIGVIK